MNEKLRVTCSNGIFKGLEKNGVAAYKGIPFAKSPIGDLRWRAPQAPDNSSEEFEAYELGKAAIQYKIDSERASHHVRGEDCLTLNIWTDMKTEEKKPVMVFIHGGAFAWGGSADPLYDGQNFVEAHGDIVLVTINYRLGLMGFIDFSEVRGGESYKDAPLLGMLDIIAALRWINENIEGFGGDKENVTIFGESAGSAAIGILLTMPEGDGLYHRAIMESGPLGRSGITADKTEQCEFAAKFMEAAGCKTMEDLLALTEQQIIDIEEEHNISDYSAAVQADGVHIPLDPYQAMKDGASKDVDLLIGTLADEYNYYIGEMGSYETFAEWVQEKYEAELETMPEFGIKKIEEFLNLYPDRSDTAAKTEYFNETGMRLPSINGAVSHSDNGGRTFMYYWKYPSANEGWGAAHAVDLAYVFNNLQETIFTGPDPDSRLAIRVQKAWVNFAKTGDPSTDEYEWPEFNSETRKTMIIDSEWYIEEDPLRESRKILESVIPYVNPIR